MTPTATDAAVSPSAVATENDEATDVVAEDVLVEEVSIDGMCGVY